MAGDQVRASLTPMRRLIALSAMSPICPAKARAAEIQGRSGPAVVNRARRSSPTSAARDPARDGAGPGLLRADARARTSARRAAAPRNSPHVGHDDDQHQPDQPDHAVLARGSTTSPQAASMIASAVERARSPVAPQRQRPGQRGQRQQQQRRSRSGRISATSTASRRRQPQRHGGRAAGPRSSRPVPRPSAPAATTTQAPRTTGRPAQIAAAPTTTMASARGEPRAEVGPFARAGSSGRHARRPRRSAVRGWRSAPRSAASSAGREIGPERLGEFVFGIGRLPEQEVRGPRLAAGADHQIGVGQIARCPARPQAPPRRSRRASDRPPADVAAQASRAARSNLVAPAVVDGDGQVQPVKPRRPRLDPGHQALQLGVQPRAVADEAHPHALRAPGGPPRARYSGRRSTSGPGLLRSTASSSRSRRRRSSASGCRGRGRHSTISRTRSAPLRWPTRRGQPRLRGPAAIAVHDDRDMVGAPHRRAPVALFG